MQRVCAGDGTQKPLAPTEGGHGIEPLCKECAQETGRRSLWCRQKEDMELNPYAKSVRRRRDAEAFGADRRRTWNATLMQRFFAGDETEKPEVAPTPTEGGHGIQPFGKDSSQETRRRSLRWRPRRQKEGMEFNPFAKIVRRRCDGGASGGGGNKGRRTWNSTFDKICRRSFDAKGAGCRCNAERRTSNTLQRNPFDFKDRRSSAERGSHGRCNAERRRTCNAILWMRKFAGALKESREPIHDSAEGQPLNAILFQKDNTVQEVARIRGRSGSRKSLRRSCVQDMLDVVTLLIEKLQEVCRR